jgi:hypothetical protein
VAWSVDVEWASSAPDEATLEQRQRLQQLFFPDGVLFDGTPLFESE